MTEQTKQRLKYWLIGLFTGGAVATPMTAFVTKKICDKKMAEAVAKASDEGENRGMNAMAEYAISQQKAEAEKPMTEEEYGEVIKRDENGKPIIGRYPYNVGVPADEDINNYDLSIDDVEATEEARERTEAHERYLDMIDKYNGNTEIQPHIINGEQFITEQYMEKSYVNWYEADNVFEEDLEVIEDPYATFGVTDGHELFKNAELREDPDICYVRNELVTTDFEITRVHGSYAEMVGGERSLGKTDT